MKVRALNNFYDIENELDRVVGDAWECTKERKDKLVNLGWVEAISTPRKTKEKE